MHNTPQWLNKHLLPPHIDNKRKEPELMPHLKELIKRLTELCLIGLEACHCAKEFILWQIYPLARQEKLAFECPRFGDPNRNPSASKDFEHYLPLILRFECDLTPLHL
jgi:hypothetical protein